MLYVTELSQARQEAFDSFRKNYADTSNINDHKKMLKIKYVAYTVYWEFFAVKNYFSPVVLVAKIKGTKVFCDQ